MKHTSLFIFILLMGAMGFSQPPDYSKINIDHYVKCPPVEDQQYSSTCWSFASSSFIETEIYREQGFFYDLSEMYFARKSYTNKINAYLQSGGTIYFTPGGQFHDVLEVIKTNGAVPENDYTGLTSDKYAHDHSVLDTLVWKYTLGLIKMKKKVPSAADWKVYNNMFNTYLGKDVSSISWDGKTITPTDFVKDVLRFDPDNYIEITSYTHHPFYETFVLEDKFNWMKKKYYNVPLEDFMAITNHAINTGYSVCWDGDVTETTFDQTTWGAYLEPGTKATQESRQTTFEDQSTTIDHMMHVVGYGKDDKHQLWYYVKNSWGKSGPNLGYFCMSENYFKLKTVAIIVHKDAIPKEIRTKMKL